MDYVLDTSVVVKLFYEEDYSDKARDILRHSAQNSVKLMVPVLILFELNNVFVSKQSPKDERDRFRRQFFRLVETGFIELITSAGEADLEASADMAATPTGGQAHIRTFDSVFHTLAIRREAMLVTADRPHVTKTRDIFGSVVHIEELKL